ncbi:hypothetical protein P9112_008207 [Eukaryota sp. TZLM1-RC]
MATQTLIRRSVDVRGSDRPLFFRRPVLPFLSALTPQELISTSNNLNPLDPPTPRPPSPPTRTIGISTDYREADVQTDPYTPDYTIPTTSSQPPEVLSLTALKYGQGLPAGRAEVDLIINARKRRLFEANLPTDFDLRVEALAERDKEDWGQREAVIKKIQDAELDQLEETLLKQTQEIDHYIETRVAAHQTNKARMLLDKLEMLHRKRDATCRNVSKRLNTSLIRGKIDSGIDSKLSKPTPRAEVDVSLLRDLNGINELENYLIDDNNRNNSNNLKKEVFDYHEIDIKTASKKARLSALKKGRGLGNLKDTRLLNSLDLVVSTCKSPENTSSQSKIIGSKTIKKTVSRDELAIIRRPMTPCLRAIDRPECPNVVADVDSEPEEDPSVAFGSVDAARKVNRSKRQEIRRLVHNFERMVVKGNEAVVHLQALIRGRSRQTQFLTLMERKRDLIAEVRAEETYKVVLNELEQRRDVERARRVEKLVEKQRKTQKIGNVLGSKLDFLAKELVRKREEMRLVKIMEKAVKEREIRENLESEKRAQEEIMAKQRQEKYEKLRRVHGRAASVFVDDVFDDVALGQNDHVVSERSRGEVAESGNVLGDLLLCNVIAGVEDELVRKRISLEQNKIKLAVNESISGLI